MNTSPALDEAIIDTELRHIKFFNGRLLTGGDLEAEQSAQHAHSRQLGAALGTGVVFGLEVTAADTSPPHEPIVHITAGLAVNRAGQTLQLQCNQQIALLGQPDPTNVDACIFNDCEPKSTRTTLASGIGFYLLVIAPASRQEGKAQVSGLGNGPALCNSRYLAEGVKFRLLRLSVTSGTSAGHLRNAVAYQCFGLPGMTPNDFVRNALNRTPSAGYGAESMVPEGYLTGNDVPLAIIEWTATGMGYADMWPVRRRLIRSSAETSCEPVIGERRLAEGEAMFSQFAQQMNDLLRAEPNPSQLTASDRFIYLPPVGVLSLARLDGSTAFNADQFFAGQAVHPPVFLNAALVEILLRDALRYPPINLSQRDPIRLFRIVNGTAVEPYLIFATALLAFPSEARFDISRWDFANLS